MNGSTFVGTLRVPYSLKSGEGQNLKNGHLKHRCPSLLSYLEQRFQVVDSQLPLDVLVGKQEERFKKAARCKVATVGISVIAIFFGCICLQNLLGAI